MTCVFPRRVLTPVRPNGFPTAIDFAMDQNVVDNRLGSARMLGDRSLPPTSTAA